MIIRTKRSLTSNWGLVLAGVSRGFTLIEAVVVVAIIGLLIALILPAVQGARESSRRLACQNNLKQLGVGLAGFNSARGNFPTGILPSPASSPSHPIAVGPLSAHFQLLPFIELSSLYGAVNLQASVLHDLSGGLENGTAYSSVVASFQCPSDSSGLAGGCNYRANVGPNPYEFEEGHVPGGMGAFPGFKFLSPGDFTDGLSTTAGFSERLTGKGSSTRFDPHRDVWLSGLSKVSHEITSDILVKMCQNPGSGPLEFWGKAGVSWLPGRYADSLYNHVATPNPVVVDCSADSAFGSPGDISGGAISARSNHPGGVLVLFMDGSVRWLKQTVQLKIWRSIGSRKGGELIDESF